MRVNVFLEFNDEPK